MKQYDIIFSFKEKLRNNFPLLYESNLGKFARDFIGFRLDLYKQKRVANYFYSILEECLSVSEDECLIKPKKIIDTEKIIWQYWGQGVNINLPPLVKLSFLSVDKYKGDFKIIRLDDKLINDYLEIPSFILDKLYSGNLSRTFFSDILRLALLYYYGGVWIDATIVLSSEINKSYLENELFFFERNEFALDKKKWFKYNRFYFSWHPKHKIRMMNGFLCCKKNSRIVFRLLILLLYYHKNNDSLIHYFIFQIFFNEMRLLNIIDENSISLDDDTYPHLLLSKLTDKFNEHQYNNVLNKTNIHVLRHNIPLIDGSFYEYIINSLDHRLIKEFKKN